MWAIDGRRRKSMTSITEQKIFDIIGDIYVSASADSNDGWQDTYVKLCTLLESGPGSLNIFDKRTATYIALGDTNHVGFLEEFNSRYYSLLPFRKNIESLGTGESFDRERDFPKKAFLDSELYRSCFREMGYFHIFHHCIVDVDRFASTMTFSRPKNKPNFGRDERRALGVILPHLQHTMRHHIDLANARWEARLSAAAFERMTQAVIVVDAAHRVVFSNNRGTELLGSNDGMALANDGRLKLAHSGEARRLRSLLDRIFSSGSGLKKEFGAALHVSRKTGRRPYQVVISRIFESSFQSNREEALAMIIVSDPEDSIAPSDRVLVELFDMTATEARITSLLTDGLDINEVCKELKVTCNTVRTHLKHIFSKTDTHRQSELITLIAKLPS